MDYASLAMPSFEVMRDALACLLDKDGKPVMIDQKNEYSSLPNKAIVCKQVVQLFKANSATEFNLSLKDGVLYDGVTCIGSEGTKEDFIQKVSAIQMWFLNPWRSLDFFLAPSACMECLVLGLCKECYVENR
jgi:hypothetical protein